MRERKGESTCERGELLVSVLYGEATAEELALFEAHRRECASCDDEMAAFARVRDDLRGWELGAVPAIRVEVRPGFLERIARAFAILPLAARVATAGACALLLLAAVNTEVRFGDGGVSVRTALFAPAPAAAPVETAASDAAATLTEADVERIVAERTAEIVRAQFVSQRAELDAHLADLERQLVTARSTGDVKRLSVQVAAQRRKIDQLERDLDRSTGYGGGDLFGAALAPDEPVPGS
jgi:hypothetical protein